MYRYLQVVENILYSGSADMKVLAHNLNVSIFVGFWRSYFLSNRSFSFPFFSLVINYLLRLFILLNLRLFDNFSWLKCRLLWRKRETIKTTSFYVKIFFLLLAEWRTCKILWRPHYECQRSSGCGQCAGDVMPRQTDSLLWSYGKWLHINSCMMHILLHCTQVLFTCGAGPSDKGLGRL